MSLKYRPEIDGLRAIAVVAVVLYHAKFIINGKHFLAGGFIGVDIFFVISGYLITSILLKEINQGTFSFLSFYDRRARRILPALFTVMLASIPFAWIQFFPKEMKMYSGSILSSLGFSSNIWFSNEVSYWAGRSDLKPFLHTWSLSVEEQFYVIFPILLLLLFKVATKYIFHIMTLLLLASLTYGHFTSQTDVNSAFYLLPYRGWEILAGSLLANINTGILLLRFPRITKIIPVIGITLISLPFFYFDQNTHHPSLLTLIPVFGTALLIGFCQKDELITKILSHKILTGIGLVSYGFYLWHFPVFAFTRTNLKVLPLYIKGACILVSLLLAILMYLLIETPIRKRKSSFVHIGLLLTFLFLTGIQLYSYKTAGAKFRFANFNKHVELYYWDNDGGNREKFSTYDGCWATREKTIPQDPFKKCKANEQLRKHNTIMVIGDSNTASIIPGLIKHFGKNAIVQRTVNSCLPSTKQTRYCARSFSVTIKELRKTQPTLIIIGGMYKTVEDSARLRDFINQELKEFKNKIIVLGPLPRWRHLPKRLYKLFLDSESFSVPKMLRPKSKTFKLEKALKNMTSEMGITYLSPVQTFCNNTQCLVKTGDKPNDITTWDGSHLTHSSSHYLIEKNLKQINGYLSHK